MFDSALSQTIPFKGLYPIPGDGGIWMWQTVGDLVLELGRPGSGLLVTIEDGMHTDLASIPRWLHWLINPFDPQTAEAAVGHDGLLRLGIEQRVAAGEFYRLLRKARFPRWKCVAFYLAVLAASDRW